MATSYNINQIHVTIHIMKANNRSYSERKVYQLIEILW